MKLLQVKDGGAQQSLPVSKKFRFIKEYTEQQAVEIALIENIQREI